MAALLNYYSYRSPSHKNSWRAPSFGSSFGAPKAQGPPSKPFPSDIIKNKKRRMSPRTRPPPKLSTFKWSPLSLTRRLDWSVCLPRSVPSLLMPTTAMRRSPLLTMTSRGSIGVPGANIIGAYRRRSGR